MSWQPIETHAGRYEVSRSGAVRFTGGRELKQWTNSQGYRLVRLSGPRIVARVHRLVASAFVANHSGLPFVNHIDCDRANNVATNLEWCTQQQNLKHAADLGRMQRNYWRGKRSPNAALTDAAAAEIRTIYAAGGISLAALGRRYSSSKRTVGRIVHGDSYV